MGARILVLDDKPSMLQLLERVLGEGHEVVTAPDGAKGLALIAAGGFDVVLSDIRMPGADGMEVLRETGRLSPGTEVILMTAFATVQTAIEAMKLGAFDYLEKPFDPEEALVRVERAVEHKLLRDRADRLARDAQERSSFAQLIGESEPMQEVFALLHKAAASDFTVLITGESGTGKELAARGVHFSGPRRDQPFVPVNCGALPANLVESELFGHVRGSFTGAAQDKKGLVEEAGAGTLFLDESGDLPLQLQVKLNRAFQEREYRRVGDTRTRRIEARLVAATNLDLRAEVAEGRFREDLFYRLNVFPVRLPALRERATDVPSLAAQFLVRLRERSGTGPTGFDPEAVRLLLAYDWPGNVRELENCVERAFAVSSAERILPADLPPEVKTPAAPAAGSALAALPYREVLEIIQERGLRDYLDALLTVTKGNVSRAAEKAEMARESMHRLLKRYRVDPEKYR